MSIDLSEKFNSENLIDSPFNPFNDPFNLEHFPLPPSLEKEKDVPNDNIISSTNWGSKHNPLVYDGNENEEKNEELTIIKDNFSIKKKENEKIQEHYVLNNGNEMDGNELFSFDKIKKEIFPKLNISNEIKNKIIKDEEILKNIEKFKKIKTENEFNSEEIYGELKFGRKKRGDKSIRNHNRYSYDNVMKKIKSEIFDCLLSFINIIFNAFIDKNKKTSLFTITYENKKVYDNGFYLKPLNYEIIDKLKKDYNLNLLQMNLKDFFSQKITPKFKNFSTSSNKIILDEILKDETDDSLIVKALNLKFEEWLDFFTYKKNIPILEQIEIEKNVILPRADKLLNKIGSENDDSYFSIFLFLLYNVKWWFDAKRKRKENSKNKSNAKKSKKRNLEK